MSAGWRRWLSWRTVRGAVLVLPALLIALLMVGIDEASRLWGGRPWNRHSVLRVLGVVALAVAVVGSAYVLRWMRSPQ